MNSETKVVDALDTIEKITNDFLNGDIGQKAQLEITIDVFMGKKP